MKTNCWEFTGCGRQPGGARVPELGVCAASIASAADGTHGGRNGGRSCWAIVGTLCAGQVQDSLAAKLRHCVGCEFRRTVESEERDALLTPQQITQLMDACA